MKTLRTLFKQDKEAFVVPKGIQDVIPVTRIWQDGIFQVGKNKYSKCYRFTDINYAVASRADKGEVYEPEKCKCIKISKIVGSEGIYKRIRYKKT